MNSECFVCHQGLTYNDGTDEWFHTHTGQHVCPEPFNGVATPVLWRDPVSDDNSESDEAATEAYYFRHGVLPTDEDLSRFQTNEGK